MSLKQTILYLPVIHAGYEAFLERNSDSEEILILGREFQAIFPAMAKEIRALSPQRAVEYARIIARRPNIRIIEPADIPEAIFGDLVTLPDEEMMRELAELPQFPRSAKVEFQRTFLRWDRSWSQAQVPVHFDGEVSISELDQKLMGLALHQSARSSDWWRQVGAVAFRDGNLLKAAHNHHVPTEYSPYIDGDPRNEFSRGIRADLSTAIHAEAALVASCAREGVLLADADLYVSTFPCPSCARMIAEAGFRRCFTAGPYSVLSGEVVLRSAGVELVWVNLQASEPGSSDSALS